MIPFLHLDDASSSVVIRIEFIFYFLLRQIKHFDNGTIAGTDNGPAQLHVA